MFKIEKLILSLLIVTPSGWLLPQSKWEWRNPLPQGNDLHDVWIIDSLNVIVVGKLGTIIKTTDGGENWEFIEVSSDSHSLYTLWPFDSLTCYAAGSQGIFLKTIDGGDHWDLFDTGTNHALHSINFLDRLHGWAVGGLGTILETTDGGVSWNPVDGDTWDTLFSIHFVDSSLGFAVGDAGAIIKTTDGGHSWRRIDAGIITQLESVYFISDSIGWACGALVDTVGFTPPFIKTIDGGESWSVEINEFIHDLVSLTFVNSDTGWASGVGQSWVTTDAGVTWIEREDVNGLAIRFADTKLGWAVGCHGSLLRTDDGGNSWVALRKGPTEYLEAITFSDRNTGWAVGWGLAPTRGPIIKSSDGGLTWTRQFAFPNVNFYDICFPTPIRGIAVGFNYITDGVRGVVYTTDDGGENWDSRFLGTFTALDFVNDSTGWAVGWGGKILKTMDAGVSWQTQISGFEDRPHSNFHSVDFLDQFTGFVAGDPGVLRTTNGGEDWEVMSTEDLLFRAVFFLNHSIGWATGGSFYGHLLRTDDGGTTWTEIGIFPGSWLYDVLFINPDTGWTVGEYGSHYETTDGGYSWHWLPTYLGDLEDIYYSDTGTIWQVGAMGTILQLYTDTTMDIHDETTIMNLPSSYFLYQNFPNPFNTTTAITYDLPFAGPVRLSIWDLMGREITTIVNRLHQPGRYTAFWNGRDDLGRVAPSGVYFYHLETRAHSEIKKMILLR